ncbi:MAG: D-Ala-D-Ala carboxypeptidase family metallohydrolase [Kordiimonas sp.]
MTLRIDPRKQLSPHFYLGEFTRSSTAEKHQLYNLPREECDLANLRALATKVLEPAREMLGQPIHITSGFRCGTLNRLVGGAAQSQHMYGEAADFTVRDMSIIDAALTLSAQDDLPFDQLIYEVREREGNKPIEWIHVSHKRLGGNRHEVLTICNTAAGRMTRAGIHDLRTPKVEEDSHAA